MRYFCTNFNTLIMKKALLLLSIAAFGASASATTPKMATGARQIERLACDAVVTEAFADHGIIESGAGGEKYVDVLICTDGTDAVASQLQALGVKPSKQATGDFTAHVPISKLQQVAHLQGATKMRVARQLFPLLDAAKQTAFVSEVQAGSGGLSTSYNGSGVIVGLIDNGFQYDHSAFYDFVNKKSRISRIWEQRCDTVASLRPDKYDYGCEYAPGKAELGSRYYDLVTSTHGTHVAGIAAGGDTRSGNPYAGVATGSEIVMVSTKATDLSVIDAVKYIFDYATQQGKPCVINISLGSNIGPHDGTGYADRVLDSLQGEGRLIVGAAGNETGSDCHLSKTFSIKDHSLVTGLAFKSYRNTQVGQVDVWGEENKKFKARITVYNKTTGSTLASFDGIDPTVETDTVFNYKWLPDGASDSAVVTIDAATGIDGINNKPNVNIYATALNIDKKSIYLSFEITAASGRVDMWCDGTYSAFDNMGKPECVTSTDACTVCELGGTGKRIISVGAFCTKNSYTNLGGSAVSYGTTIGSIASYSSLGPTIDGRVKPEITAPGSVLVSAYSRYYAAFKTQYMVSAMNFNNVSSYYGALQGTSMSAPFVAGVMALWLQADHSLTPERAKELIRLSAINDSFTGNVRTTGSDVWGYGKINALDGLKLCIESGVSDIVADGFRGACTASGGVLRVTPSVDASRLDVTVCDLLGRTVATASRLGVAAFEPVEVTGVPQGVLLVAVSTPSGTRSFKVLSTK